MFILIIKNMIKVHLEKSPMTDTALVMFLMCLLMSFVAPAHSSVKDSAWHNRSVEYTQLCCLSTPKDLSLPQELKLDLSLLVQAIQDYIPSQIITQVNKQVQYL